MSQETINKSLQNTLLSPLTHDELWPQFLEALSYEIYNMRCMYGSIQNNWNINENDKDNLIRIANSFGYDPNLILNNTIYMAKKEIESISYRIRKKTTYDGYLLNFKQNDIIGEVYNYYHNGYKLIKAIDYNKTIEFLNNSDHYSPFSNVIAIKNFSSIMDSGNIMLNYLVNGEVKYDDYNVRIYSLDQKMNPYWRLDTTYIRIPTNHLGIEYFPQHYYCSYITSISIGEENVHIYELEIPIKNYLRESITLKINNEEIPITINTVDDIEYFQDDDSILDSTDSYYDIENGLLHLNFNIIPIDKEISIGYDVDLLMTQNYFYYLEHGAEYNRSTPIIPHAGIFVTAEIASSRGSDFYYPNEEGYTIPDLKLKAITASVLNRYITVSELSRLDNATDEEGQPTGKDNYRLDSSIKWFLDSSSEQSVPLKDTIKYIACGNQALNVINEKNIGIFNQQSMIFCYNLNTDDDTDIINDISSNNIDCLVVGDTVKVKGIISKSLNFNGNTYAYSTSALSMEPTVDYSFGIWFNANKEPQNNIETIFDSFINISYDYENEKLIIDETNDFDCPKNTDIFLVLIFHANSTNVSIYINSVLLGSFSYTMILTSKPIYIGTNESHDANFYGIIDNLWILTKIITQSDIDYIYNNKISVISHMGNRIGYYELYDDEKYEDDNYLLVQSYVKSMDVTNENISIENDSSDYYSSKTKLYPIMPSYFTMKYKNSLNETVTLKANEKGELFIYNPLTQTIGEQITGGIDFVNGEWNLAKSTIKSISQSKIDSPRKENYSVAYHIINEEDDTDKWYTTYDPTTGIPTGEINADEIVTDGATSHTTLYIYYEDNDISPKTKIYSSDNESFYIKKNGSDFPLGAYVINSDNSETHLFSIDSGKTLFHNLTNLTNDTNQITTWVDLGESSNTTIYSIDNGTTMYLNVACTSDKRVKKWVNDADDKLIGYTLNGEGIVYSNLAFTSILDNSTSNWTEDTFNKMSIISKVTQINLDLTTIQSIDTYENIYSINYIDEITQYIDNISHPDKVPNTISFSYWLDVNGVITKYTALINESGEISGENILNGNFNYSTNLLYVQFREKVKSDVVISYNYYNTLDLDYNQSISMDYKIEKPVYINEIGLEDENHELVAYMTIPNVLFNDIYNNISAMFAIAKN